MDANTACDIGVSAAGDGDIAAAAGQSGRGPALQAEENLSTIREVAHDFGVSVRALRFYEDRGLLRPRRHGSTRLYGAQDRRDLRMVLKGKRLGFTLAEIADMMSQHSGALEADGGDLEMALPPEQIVAQIGFLERQRQDLDAAILALRKAHIRMLESPCRAAVA